VPVPTEERSSPSDSLSEPRVLVIEDDTALTTVLAKALAARGFSVQVMATGQAALEAASVEAPDVVVLDLGLPDMDGIDVCRQLRAWFANPIIVLSADGDEDRKVAALDEGADDYVTKPFSMPELLARLRVALRHRRTSAAVAADGVIALGDLVIDVGAHAVAAGGAPLELRPKEFELLLLLARNAGRVMTHGALATRLWGGPAVHHTESLRWHVMHLRKRLGEGAERPRLVTEPGVGYRLIVSS